MKKNVMKKRRIFISVVLTLALTLSSIVMVSGTENSDQIMDPYYNEENGGTKEDVTLDEYIEDSDMVTITETNETARANQEDIPKLDTKKYIEINGQKLELLSTFEDKDAAFEEAKVTYATIIAKAQNFFSLEDFSRENWKEYKGAILDLPLDNLTYEENLQTDLMRSFFGICENDEYNGMLIALTEEYNKTEDKSILSEIDAVAPYIWPNLSEETSSSKGDVRARAKLNVTAAFNYGYKYVGNPNRTQYTYYAGSNCANFVSQMIYAGGIKQVATNSVYSGWWHKTRWTGKVLTHSYSRSWLVANEFAKYWKVGYKTKNHNSFSANLKAGDIIALDFEKDGKWDHLGFVTQTAGKISAGYYNYRVIQNTKNYLAWVSNKYNNWETYHNKAFYGRIRL